MAPMKSLLSILTFSVALSLGLFSTPGFSTQRQAQLQPTPQDQKLTRVWEVSQTFKPPNRGAPPRTDHAGSRNDSCVSSSDKIALLLPEKKPEESPFGLTVSKYPTFFGYIPQSSAQIGEFILIAQNNQIVHRTRFALPSQPGIVSISLPAKDSPPLEVGKRYQWFLIIVCNPDDRSENAISTRGWIERIQPSQIIVEQLLNGTPRSLPAVYANAGIWYEALTSLVDLRRLQPDDPMLEADWEELLKSVGLKQFIQKPLFDCCKAE